MGLGAAYTGHAGHRIGRVAFVALNIFPMSLVFGNAKVAAVSVPVVLASLWWHQRTDSRSTVHGTA